MPWGLRLGTAVRPVDDGLLLCAETTELLRCGPGVRRLWEALEPVLDAGLDPAELADLPPPAAEATQQLLSRLGRADVLVETETGVPGVLRVTGRCDWTDDLLAGLNAAGLSATAVDGDAESGVDWLAVHRLQWTCSWPAGGGATGVGREHVIRVGWIACDEGDRLLVMPDERHWAAALAAQMLVPASRPRPGPLDLRVAAAVMAEVVRRRSERRVLPGPAAEVSSPSAQPAVLVGAGGAQPVALPAPPRIVAPAAPDGAGEPEVPRRDDEALLSELAPLTAPPFGPWRPREADALPQRALALHTLRSGHAGAGATAAAATVDAVLGALRGLVRAAPSLPRGAVEVAAAGHGEIDFLADGVGRLLVRDAATDPALRPADPPADGWAAHWWEVARHRLGHPPRLGWAPSRLAPGVVLAAASAASPAQARPDHTAGPDQTAGPGDGGVDWLAWGYGTDLGSAAEHALRGLLRRAAPADDPETDDAVPTSHLPDTAPALLDAVAPGCPAATAGTRVALLAARLPGFAVWPLGVTSVVGSGLRAGRVSLG